MMRVMLAGLMIAAAGCATVTPVSRIEQRLLTLGLSSGAARCMAEGLDDRLERDDLVGVARFLEGLKPDRSAEQVVRSLGGIDNPRAAGAVATTAVSCAFGALR